MHDESVMSRSLEKMIVALCADFERRTEVINKRNAPYNVIMEYRFLNYRILCAACEIGGDKHAMGYIRDVGEGRGYAKSELSVLSENLYKIRKREVTINIARRLSLL